MLDTINLERKGIPAAVVGKDKLLHTVGQAMATVQGYPALNFAAYHYSISDSGVSATEEEEQANAVTVAPQVESILTGRV